MRLLGCGWMSGNRYGVLGGCQGVAMRLFRCGWLSGSCYGVLGGCYDISRMFVIVKELLRGC